MSTDHLRPSSIPSLPVLADNGTGAFVKIDRDVHGLVEGTTPVVSADIAVLVDDVFAPIAHDHAIADVTGLEPRLLATGTTYTFDIDSTNADDGITDPFKFVSANAAYAAVHALLPTLPDKNNNRVTLLFGNGTYSLKDLNLNFLSVGVAPLVTYTPDPAFGTNIAHANAVIAIKAKNAPSVIADNAWSGVSSQANYNSEENALYITNAGILSAAFNVKFTLSQADYSDYLIGVIAPPFNLVVDGVAFILPDLIPSTGKFALMDFLGMIGTNGFGVCGFQNWYGSELNSTIFIAGLEKKNCLTDATTTGPCKPIYLVHSQIGLHVTDISPFAASELSKIVSINPTRDNYVFTCNGSMFFNNPVACIGAIKYAPSAWFALEAAQITMQLSNSYVTPSALSQKLFSLNEKYSKYEHCLFYAYGVASTNHSVVNLSRSPVKSTFTRAQLNALFLGGVEGSFATSDSKNTANSFGTVNPEGSEYGYVGDTYQNKTTGVLYTKQSGSNTNTGWVAVSTAGHTHEIANVNGLEQRLLNVAGAYTFDCDPANADEGVTDVYKFKTAPAMYAALLAFMPRMSTNSGNSITIRFADGDYNFLDLADFLAHGAPVGRAWGYWGTPARSNCVFKIQAKNAPTAIADNAWSLITSDATEAAERAPAQIANKALIRASFKVVFTHPSAGSIYKYARLPDNCIVDGVAFVADGIYLGYLAITRVGSMGVAIHNFNANAYEPKDYDNISGYEHLRENAVGAKIFISHCSALQISHLGVTSSNPTDLTLTIVNPSNAVLSVIPNTTEVSFSYNQFVLKCLGNLETKTQGWLAFCSGGANINIGLGAGSVYKAGEVIIFLQNGSSYSPISLALETADPAPNWNIKSVLSEPAAVNNYNWATFTAKFPNRIGAFINAQAGYGGEYFPVTEISGAGNPNGVYGGKLGDKYVNTAGGANTTLWIKESGVNTKTGWVATSSVGHTHEIANINGLEPRILATGTSFTFDIDATNLDNGITDPYKFISANAAYAAVHAMIHTLKPNKNNIITMLFGDGDYQLSDLYNNFLVIGAPTSSNEIFDGCDVMRANARFILRAKNAPSIISNASWSAISSNANYAAEFDAANAINTALVQAAFKVKFVVTSATLTASPAVKAVIPQNFTLDGVAFLHTDATYTTFLDWDPTLYFDMYGQAGLNGYACVNAHAYYAGYAAAVIDQPHASNSGATHAPEAYGITSKPIYFVNSDCAAKISRSYYGSFATWVFVNTGGVSLWSHEFCSLFDNLIGIGSSGNDFRGFFNISADFSLHLKLGPSSLCPSGQVFLNFYISSYAVTPFVHFYPDSTPVTGKLIIYVPEGLCTNLTDAQLLAIFTAGVSGPRKRINYNAYPALNKWSSGSPEGVLYAEIGDTCQDRTTGKLYRKSSGANTSTGWVEVFATDTVLTALPAGTNTPVTNVDTIMVALANLQKQIDVKIGATLSGEYKFATGITAVDPSSGKVALNTASFSTVTALYISQTSNLGSDVSNFLGTLAVNDQLYLQEKNSATKFARYTVSGSLTDNGAWWTIPVTHVNSGAGGIPSNNQVCNLIAFLKG